MRDTYPDVLEIELKVSVLFKDNTVPARHDKRFIAGAVYIKHLVAVIRHAVMIQNHACPALNVEREIQPVACICISAKDKRISFIGIELCHGSERVSVRGSCLFEDGYSSQFSLQTCTRLTNSPRLFCHPRKLYPPATGLSAQNNCHAKAACRRPRAE